MRAHLVLASGGLDSTVCLALAERDGGTAPVALTFDYGQRHAVELERAAAVCAWYGAEQLVVTIDARRWGGSALTDPGMEVPGPGDSAAKSSVPATYVPARNSIFLAVALGVAEARGADAVYLGVNAVDYSGYPDCRPAFVDAFRRVAEVGQRRGIEGHPVDIRAPLIEASKADIVRLGTELGAPLELTWSCYRGGPRPCGQCDACQLRERGFAAAGVADPALAGVADPAGEQEPAARDL